MAELKAALELPRMRIEPTTVAFTVKRRAVTPLRSDIYNVTLHNVYRYNYRLASSLLIIKSYIDIVL